MSAHFIVSISTYTVWFYVRTKQMMSLNWDVCVTGTDLEMKHLRLCQFKAIIQSFADVYADLPFAGAVLGAKEIVIQKLRIGCACPPGVGQLRHTPGNFYLRQGKSLLPLLSTSFIWQILTECLQCARYVLKVQQWADQAHRACLHSSWEDRQ